MTAILPDLEPFFALVGAKHWLQRLREIRDLAAFGPRAGQAMRQRYAVELTLEKCRHQVSVTPSAAEVLLSQIAAYVPELAAARTYRLG